MAVWKVALLPCCVWLMLLQGLFSDYESLTPCVNDGNGRVAEMERGKTFRFYCRGFQAQDIVQWRYMSNVTGVVSAGTCNSIPHNGCQPGLVAPIFTARRLGNFESSMTVDPTQQGGENTVGQGTLTCGNFTDRDTCRMDLITPAVVTTCSVKFERRSNDDWQTTTRCDVTSAYSSRGRYTCRWYRKKESSPEEERSTVRYTPSSGVCNFNEDIPSVDGVYSYWVKVTPGKVSKRASFIGSNEIKKPSAPTIAGCSKDVYIENTAVSCTCRTVNVGQPAGRLVWYRAGVPVTSGNYGDDTLTVSQNLTRADHDVTQFRCDVDWATDVQGESWTFKVGCLPRGGEHLGNVSFTGDPVSVTFDVTAYPVPHKVSFTYLGRCECQAGTASAVEGITLEGRCRAKTGAVYMSTCTVTVTSAATEAAGVYHVIISNTVGNATFQLNVGVDLAPNAQSANTGNGQASYMGLAVGFGVTLAVVLIVIIVFFFWLWRRQWTLPCTRDKVELRKHPNIPDDRDSSAVVQDNQETNAHSSSSDLSTYQSLQMSDVGQMSTYSALSHHGNQPSEPAYANTVVQTGSI